MGIYIGYSPCHAGSVALVLNLKTLHISPQFHVVFDDHFNTVAYLSNREIPPNRSALVAKVESSDLAKLWVESQLNPTIFF